MADKLVEKCLLTDMNLFGQVRELMEEATLFYQKSGYIASEDTNKIIDVIEKAQLTKAFPIIAEEIFEELDNKAHATDFLDHIRLNIDFLDYQIIKSKYCKGIGE